MKKVYVPYWFRAGDVRGECYQVIEIDEVGRHALAGYCDDEGKPFALPDPHEGVLVNPRAPLDRPPHMPPTTE
jgi:hypothetical protein